MVRIQHITFCCSNNDFSTNAVKYSYWSDPLPPFPGSAPVCTCWTNVQGNWKTQKTGTGNIKFPPKRNAAFDRIEPETGKNLFAGVGIRTFCPKRWSVCGDSVGSINLH